MRQSNNFIYFVDSQLANKQKNIICAECGEADDIMFKIIRLTKNFSNKLDRYVSYLCSFHCKLNFPYYFQNKNKNKNKNQLSMFEVEL